MGGWQGLEKKLIGACLHEAERERKPVRWKVCVCVCVCVCERARSHTYPVPSSHYIGSLWATVDLAAWKAPGPWACPARCAVQGYKRPTPGRRTSWWSCSPRPPRSLSPGRRSTWGRDTTLYSRRRCRSFRRGSKFFPAGHANVQ